MRFRVPQTVRAANWRYAGSELFLIVAGILIALALDDWRTSRSERAAELSMLAQIRSSLLADREVLKASLERIRGRDERIRRLATHLRMELPYADSLDVYFGAVNRYEPVHLNRSPYESLKTRGLNLISSDSLRIQMLRVYDQVYANAAEATANDRNVIFEVVRPYIVSNFRDVRFGESATPLNYRALQVDPLFQNILVYRLHSLRVNALEPFESAIREIDILLAFLDRELGLVQ